MSSNLAPAQLLIAKRAAMGIGVGVISVALAGLSLLFSLRVAFDSVLVPSGAASAVSSQFAVVSLLQAICGAVAALALFSNWRVAAVMYWAWVGAVTLLIGAMALIPVSLMPLAVLAGGSGGLLIIGARWLMRLYPNAAPAV